MDRSCLDHRLTDEERQQFQRDGYFVIEKALDFADNSSERQPNRLATICLQKRTYLCVPG
jgi:hypothetical protein